tara:strand:- start:1101 stop:1496 length:396 start_codon:yes stop_codon:yes gene_type:complete
MGYLSNDQIKGLRNEEKLVYDLFRQWNTHFGELLPLSLFASYRISLFEDLLSRLPNKFPTRLKEKLLAKQKYIELKTALNMPIKTCFEESINRAKEHAKEIGVPLSESIEDFVKQKRIEKIRRGSIESSLD